MKRCAHTAFGFHLTLVCIGVAVIIFTACFGRNAQSPDASPEAAKRFLKLKGYEVDPKGFFTAVALNDLPAVNAFISAKFDINVRDSVTGRTALIMAAASGDLPIVKSLTKAGADLNAEDKGNKPALFHAIEARYDEVSDFLVVQPRLNLNARGKNGVTALISYVWRDQVDVVKGLLDRGASVNLQDGDGDTALHGAAQSGNVEIINLLLLKGADPNIQNKVGGTPLMWAAAYGNDKVVEVLLQHRADATLKDGDGKTAKDWARQNKRDSVLQILQRGN
jgi:ankyrin repeat protein